jgi:hypothetical protein
MCDNGSRNGHFVVDERGLLFEEELLIVIYLLSSTTKYPWTVMRFSAGAPSKFEAKLPMTSFPPNQPQRHPNTRRLRRMQHPE